MVLFMQLFLIGLIRLGVDLASSSFRVFCAFRPWDALLSIVTILSLASGCVANYHMVLRDNGSADIELSAEMSPRTTILIGNLSDLGGSEGSEDPNPLDAEILRRSVANSETVVSVHLSNPDSRSVVGSLSFSDLEGFIAAAKDDRGSNAQLFYLERMASRKGGRLTISLKREEAPDLLLALSPEITDYLTALMAPVVTGEILTASEYLEIVAAAYGQAVADEIAAGSVEAIIDLPEEPVELAGGKARGKSAVFSVPLLDILLLEKDIELSALWE